MAWEALTKGDNNFDVIVIGAGISGINFGYRLQERCPNFKYAILEGRHELGGTWSLFKYPGIRSDSDLHTFGFSWRPWQEHTSIAQGNLIKNYLVESAEMYGIDKHIRYNTKVSNADYSSSQKTWSLQTTVHGQEQKTYKCRFMIMATGYYDYETPLQTNIPGISNFKGAVIHPQFWPEDLDYTDKHVVVIGSGATAITVLPVMAEKARRVTMLQRSPSYVMSVPTQDGLERFIRRWLSWAPTFRDLAFRIKWIISPLLLTTYSRRYPEKMKAMMAKITEKQLPASIPRDPHFAPNYNPWEQRMCMSPDGDFFKSLRSGKSDIVTGHIENITEDTIKLTDGQELSPDIIVTATGLKLRFAGGMSMSIDNKPYNPPEKYVWKGVMLEDLPNTAFVVGYVDASWTLGADATAQLITRMMNEMKKNGTVEVTPRRSEKEIATMNAKSLLNIQSTYVEKGKAMLPKAGDSGQWVARSNYVRDIFMAWFGDIKTGTEWVRGV